jgi:hypothetical protein
MIVFDLKCDGGHVFEAWFASSSAYEDQRARRLLACPVCGDMDVGKAVMAPNVSAKGNRRADVAPVAAPAPPIDPARAKAMLAALAAAQGKALETSRWVGRRFADEARAIHSGETPDTPIHGQATRDEAIALIEDGIEVMPLLVPVVPPETLN